MIEIHIKYYKVEDQMVKVVWRDKYVCVCVGEGGGGARIRRIKIKNEI